MITDSPIDARMAYDGDVLTSIAIQKGREVRPLWKRLIELKPDEMIIWSGRFDSLCSIACEWSLAQALELAAEIEVPLRTQFVRTVLCELNRLVWLTTYIGRVMKALGQNTLTQHAFILREQVLVMQEELTGGRLLQQALNLGGCRRDLALGDVQKVRTFTQGWRFSWEKWQKLLSHDPIVRARLSGLQPISTELVEKWAWWGVVGKASGIDYDVRKHRPFGAYPHVDFDLVKRTEGDAYARLHVAMGEIELAIHIVENLLKNISSDVRSRPEAKPFQKGFYFGWAESAKGPVISAVEIGKESRVISIRMFATNQRVWPRIDKLFAGLRAEDFEVAYASLGLSAEEAEI